MTRNLWFCTQIFLKKNWQVRGGCLIAPLSHQSHWHKTCHVMLSNFKHQAISFKPIWKLQITSYQNSAFSILSQLPWEPLSTPWNFPHKPWEPGTCSILLSCEAMSKQQAISPRKSDLRSNRIQSTSEIWHLTNSKKMSTSGKTGVVYWFLLRFGYILCF